MSPPRRSAAVLVILLLAACGDGGSGPSATASPSDAGSPATTTSPAAGATATSHPTGGDREHSFTCDLPIVEPGTAPIANIVDVRVGTHDGHDRLVFEFDQGTPEFTLDRSEPPFTADASGAPLEVAGESFLGLVMRGGTKQTDAGDSSYDGSTEFEPGFHTLLHAVEAGDFERQSTWYLGLAEEECVRVLQLDEPPRLVIDVEH